MSSANKLARRILAAVAISILAPPLAAQTTDFGDDVSLFANDGACDDVRFVGPGMARKPTPKSRLLEAARRMMADGNRYEAERAQAMYERGLSEQSYLDEQAAERAQANVRHDATDCRIAFEHNRIQLR